MDGQNRRNRPGIAGIAHVDGGQRRLPVVGMHEIGRPLRQESACDCRSDIGENGEPLPVVGMVDTVFADIGAARTIIERRRVQDEKIETLTLRFEQPGRVSEEIGEEMHGSRIAHFGEYGGIAGDQAAGAVPACRKDLRQCPGHVGKAAGLDQGEDFRRHRQYVHAGHVPLCNPVGLPAEMEVGGKAKHLLLQ